MIYYESSQPCQSNVFLGLTIPPEIGSRNVGWVTFFPSITFCCWVERFSTIRGRTSSWDEKLIGCGHSAKDLIYLGFKISNFLDMNDQRVGVWPTHPISPHIVILFRSCEIGSFSTCANPDKELGETPARSLLFSREWEGKGPPNWNQISLSIHNFGANPKWITKWLSLHI